MYRKLPRLRADLEFMPSPLSDRPGLLIRDSMGYSETTLIIPPLLVNCLRLFDGEATELDLRKELVEPTGDLRVGDLGEHLLSSLSQAGFLEDERYEALRSERRRAFAESPVRHASHAGSAYPEDPSQLRAFLADLVGEPEGVPSSGSLIGIAAPHVSYQGGRSCYRKAYACLADEFKDRTFVVLGTSHYGQPDRFGLTLKPYQTPLGATTPAVDLAQELAERAPAAVVMEDYCHAVEHSIEFQVLLLQHIYGPGVKVLPVLCGSYARSLWEGGLPEDDGAVGAFLSAFRELAAARRDDLFFVLGIDLAHMGARYGDQFQASAGSALMNEVADQDRRYLERVAAGDAEGFWDMMRRDRDRLKWCGASVLYTFLRIAPKAKGRLLDYDQWNIDQASAVSFAALAFEKP